MFIMDKILVMGDETMPFSIFILLFVILAAATTMVAVMYFGTKEDLNVHMDTPEAFESVNAWRERAERVEEARKALVTTEKK